MVEEIRGLLNNDKIEAVVCVAVSIFHFLSSSILLSIILYRVDGQAEMPARIWQKIRI